MRRTRFSGVIPVLGVCLLVGTLATQALAQDAAETQATATQASRLQAKLQAKVMTDEQMDQVTAGSFVPTFWGGLDLVKAGAFALPMNPLGGIMQIRVGINTIIVSLYPFLLMP